VFGRDSQFKRGETMSRGGRNGSVASNPDEYNNRTHCSVLWCPLLSAGATSSGINGWHRRVLDGTMSRPSALYALSSVSGCRIRAARIRHQGRHKGRPSALRSMRLCLGRSGGAGARAWPPSPRPARLAGFSSRHKNCAQPVASERTADTVGHYPVTVNPPTPSACGQWSGALR
jgi:hypothetical protein